jgi:hypothetical protein
MNLRQKHKKLKQELEWYKKQMVPTREVRFDSRQMRVETLGVVHDFDIDRLQGATDDYIYDVLTRDFLPAIRANMSVDIPEVRRDFGVPYYRYRASIKVVVPDGGDWF